MFRPKRKDKRKAEKFTGAQGTDQGKSETYDYSNRVTGAKEAAAKVGYICCQNCRIFHKILSIFSKPAPRPSLLLDLGSRRVPEEHSRKRRKEAKTNFKSFHPTKNRHHVM